MISRFDRMARTVIICPSISLQKESLNMKRQLCLILLIGMGLLAACGTSNTPEAIIQNPTPTEAIVLPTSTPDPCAKANVEATIKEVNDLMREFDDASKLASNLAKDQLPPSISDMQRIRRAAEDQIVPKCMAALKQHQLAHMNSVINTLLAFVGGADSNTLNNGLAQARKEHDQYTLEIIKLLGITPVAPTATP
jgi:hypothetical protein